MVLIILADSRSVIELLSCPPFTSRPTGLPRFSEVITPSELRFKVLDPVMPLKFLDSVLEWVICSIGTHSWSNTISSSRLPRLHTVSLGLIEQKSSTNSGFSARKWWLTT